MSNTNGPVVANAGQADYWNPATGRMPITTPGPVGYPGPGFPPLPSD